MIEWQEIREPGGALWNAAIALYEQTFPPEVREPAAVFVRSMRDVAGFHFLVGVDEQGQLAAMATAHDLADVNVGFVVYLVVAPQGRSRGLGAELLAQVEAALREDARVTRGAELRGVVLESEREELVHTEEERLDCQRRERFFARQGYERLDGVDYVQPPLTPESELMVPLHLWAKRFPNQPEWTAEEIRDVVRSMYRNKYGRANGTSDVVLSACERRISIE